VHAPTRWLDRLRDLHAGQFSLALAADLKLQLRAASGRWLREFYELGKADDITVLQLFLLLLLFYPFFITTSTFS
jgi:hypothetical protein